MREVKSNGKVEWDWERIPKTIARPFEHDVDVYFLREDIKKIVESRDQGLSISEISRMRAYSENAVEWAINYALKYARKPSI